MYFPPESASYPAISTILSVPTRCSYPFLIRSINFSIEPVLVKSSVGETLRKGNFASEKSNSGQNKLLGSSLHYYTTTSCLALKNMMILRVQNILDVQVLFFKPSIFKIASCNFAFKATFQSTPLHPLYQYIY